jgi:hypothetical protein
MLHIKKFLYKKQFKYSSLEAGQSQNSGDEPQFEIDQKDFVPPSDEAAFAELDPRERFALAYFNQRESTIPMSYKSRLVNFLTQNRRFDFKLGSNVSILLFSPIAAATLFYIYSEFTNPKQQTRPNRIIEREIPFNRGTRQVYRD